MSRLLLWLAARLVPGNRRAEWLERWRAEVWALQQDSQQGGIGVGRFVLGAFPDAIAEAVDEWRDVCSWSGLGADVRDAWRSGRTSPMVTLTTVVILGLGAASAATVFSLADALLLRPLPGLAEPDRLIQVGRRDPAHFDNFSYPNYRDLRDGLTNVVDLAGWANTTLVVGTGPDADVVRGQLVTANYFKVVGVTMSGPGLPDGDERAFLGRRDVVVSEAFLRKYHLAEDGRGAGAEVVLNGDVYRVAGVTPANFVGVDAGAETPYVWIPLMSAGISNMAERLDDRGWSWLQTIGRLRPDVPVAAARAAAVSLHGQLAEAYGATIGDTITVVDGAGLDPPGRALATQLFGVFMAAALLVLVVATANAAGLQFSRNLGRRHELSIRLSLGASRLRVLRALLVEQTLFAAFAGAVAFIVTWWSSSWLLSALPYEVAPAIDPTHRQLFFALTASLVIGALVGFWPLMSVVRSLSHDSLKVRQADPGRLRIGRVLVVTELAVSGVLLCLTLLMARSVVAASEANPGFTTDNAVVLTVRPMPNRSVDSGVLLADALERLRAVPGVVDAAAASSLPVVDAQSSRTLFAPGSEYEPEPRRVPAIASNVTAGYFDALGIPLVAGRGLVAADRVGSEVPVVINASLAGRLFEDEAALGQAIPAGPVTYRVVGVAAQTSLRSLRDSQLPALWLPVDSRGQFPSRFIVRVAGAPEAALADLRSALLPISDDLLVRSTEPLAPLVAHSLGDTRLLAQLAIVFGGLALLISAVGLHAISSAQVARRRHEIGVRLAVGATPHTIVREMIRSAAMTALVGSAIGVAGIVLAGPQINAFLFNVRPADPIAALATVGVLALASVVAVIGPARRAGRTDPLVVMRES